MKKKFTVSLKVIEYVCYEVEAETPEEAEDMAEEMYNNGNLMYNDTEFEDVHADGYQDENGKWHGIAWDSKEN